MPTETLRISAQADYAIRALAELAVTPPGTLVAAETIADREGIPLRFLLGILNNLRRAGILESKRGHRGGYRLARPADQVTLAAVIEAVDRHVLGKSWTRTVSESRAEASVHEIWISLRRRIDGILESTTIADVVAGQLRPEQGAGAPVRR